MKKHTLENEHIKSVLFVIQMLQEKKMFRKDVVWSDEINNLIVCMGLADLWRNQKGILNEEEKNDIEIFAERFLLDRYGHDLYFWLAENEDEEVQVKISKIRSVCDSTNFILIRSDLNDKQNEMEIEVVILVDEDKNKPDRIMYRVLFNNILQGSYDNLNDAYNLYRKKIRELSGIKE
ncbi:hypothetical protein JOC94_002320 [Bacillus thermophilus]|uniref:Uncharacterized protein n=2 Tax=Siminovitchia TaxID=2837510 RepID=A0A429X9R9_SIMTE|nr:MULTISPECIES: hypothetical protein [Siminovitchia]MBM7715333.1 hypothetical protein [Siminovitchia thermophila]RST60140.1 hypothetical protein D5F11_008765 [Siminovitchia terrae]